MQGPNIYSNAIDDSKVGSGSLDKLVTGDDGTEFAVSCGGGEEFDAVVFTVSMKTFSRSRDIVSLRDRLEGHLRVWLHSEDVNVRVERMVRFKDPS